MTGATGNVYCGLHEFADMAFVMHFLRAEDLFVDVGANVGSYTVLASAAVGAHVICFEPSPSSFAALMDNINLNGVQAEVRAINAACGGAQSTMRFTSELDTVNHVATGDDLSESTIEVAVTTCDDSLAGETPALVKIDVEGFETEVINGAQAMLRNPRLKALVMELNGSGRRYGFDEAAIMARLCDFGFVSARYEPFSRELSILAAGQRGSDGNTLFVRDIDEVRERLKTARKYQIRDNQI
jgi:FkbM family methyltransferase